MARLLTAKDVTGIMNLLYRQATGRDDIANVDLSNFASVGEQVLATGKENVLNSLSIVLGRTISAIRPYDAKLEMLLVQESILIDLEKSRIIAKMLLRLDSLTQILILI